MNKLYWGMAWAQTDVKGAWVLAKVRPMPIWWFRRVSFFLSIVWRRYETIRLDWKTSWEISRICIGLPPCGIHRGK